MDINKLAVLSNLTGGADEIENIIGVPAELIQKAINGELLTAFERAEIETGYNQLYLKPDIAIDNNLDVDMIDALADDLNLANNFISDLTLENSFRRLVADEALPADDIAKATNLFANLETRRVRTILEGFEHVDKLNQNALINNATRLQDTGKLSYKKWSGLLDEIPDIENLTRVRAIQYLRSLKTKTGKPKLSQWQQTELLTNVSDGPDMTAMLKAYEDDGEDIWNVSESLWWAWFREMFY